MTLRAKRVTGTRQICTFGARVLDRLLDAFTRQLGGVPTADNPDHIHDLRVASRRLRAALPIFRGCFTAQEYRTWMKEIRRITRTLGTARDEDVQIEFLRGKIASCQDSALLPGLEYLLAGLTKERNSAQPAVVRAIDRIHERGTFRDLSSALQGAKRVQGRGVKATGTGTIYAKARDDIRKRLDALIALETSLEDRDAVEGHHAMRIAAKWLRYTMEVYAPLYGGALDGPVSTVKRVQELLCTIHDLDVWIAHLPRVLNDTRDLSSRWTTQTFSMKQSERASRDFWRSARTSGGCCLRSLEGYGQNIAGRDSFTISQFCSKRSSLLP